MYQKKLTICISILVMFSCIVPLIASGQQELTPPRNLNAEGFDGYIDLDWRPPAVGSDRVDSYNIYRSLSSGNQEYYTSVDRYTQSFRDEDVINGRTYHYWVTAGYDTTRETDFSNEASATPLGATMPTEPRELDAYPGDAFVELEWKRPEDDGNSAIKNYIIYRGTTTGNMQETYTIGTVTEFTDTDVTNGIEYYYGVVARNDVGDSDMSNIESAMPMEGISTPSSPMNLKVLSGNSFVELYWDPPQDDGGSAIQNYKIERTDGMQRVFTTGDDTTFYHDETVTNGISYVYRVSAINAAGEGLISGEATATPTSIDIPPSVVDLQAEAHSNRIELTWSALETDLEITSYNVYRGPNANDLIYLTNTENTELTDTDVESETTYYYMVRAVSEDDKLGLESNIDTATIYEAQPPAEETENGSGLFIFGIIGLLIILVVVIIALVLLLKKKQQPKEPTNQPKYRQVKDERSPPTTEKQSSQSYDEW